MTFDMSLLVFYMLASRHGKKWYKDIFPAMRDFKEFAETMKFYLGKTKQRPKYKLFNYGEKAEYWALWWGTVIMLATGLILWFPRSLPVDTPAWVIEVARTIHFFEALLAVSAIIVWHFFNTMFHPSEYPMDTSWLTGKLTEEEAKHKFDDEAIAAQLPVKEAEEDESDATHKPKWEESKP